MTDLLGARVRVAVMGCPEYTARVRAVLPNGTLLVEVDAFVSGGAGPDFQAGELRHIPATDDFGLVTVVREAAPAVTCPGPHSHWQLERSIGAGLERDGWVGAIGVCQAFAVFGGPAARIAELTDDLRDARVYLQREREWTGSWDVSQADVRAIIEAVPESLKVAAHRLANAARLRHEERCGVVVTNLIEARAELARLRQELAALRGAK